VRPLARAAQRACVRPGCPSPARATLSFRYDSREAWLERLSEEPRPEAYDLCAPHATRTRPPHGWQLRDRRPREEQGIDEPPSAPADLGGERTVALLAAALRSVPDPSAPVPGASQDPLDAPDGVTAMAPEPLEDAPSPVLEPLRRPAPVAEGQAPRVEPDSPSTAEATLLEADPTPSVAEGQQEPRPVLAARERTGTPEPDRAPDGPARDW
jgi:hypothetical protein